LKGGDVYKYFLWYNLKGGFGAHIYIFSLFLTLEKRGGFIAHISDYIDILMLGVGHLVNILAYLTIEGGNWYPCTHEFSLFLTLVRRGGFVAQFSDWIRILMH
jgi:hypothetical protein